MKTSKALTLAAVLLAAPSLGADEAAGLDARLDLLAREDSAERLAAYARNLYEALIARGFGHNEAVQLVAAFASGGTGAAECRSAP